MMWKTTKFTIRLHLCVSLIFTFSYSFTFASLQTSRQDHFLPQIGIINAFTGCNIRVINFRGVNIDFQVVKEPIILLRYFSYHETKKLYPFELGSACTTKISRNLSSCLNFTTEKPKLPPDQIAQNYVSQTLSESFQLQSKSQNCEGNIYLNPPTERESPQMYEKNWYWESLLKNPILINFGMTRRVQRWKQNHINTCPVVSLLICTSAANSICGNEKNVQKWVAGLYLDFKFSRMPVYVIIWEYPSLSLKTLCPYCDPCDLLKVIPIQTQVIPTTNNELQNILMKMLDGVVAIRVII